jgi:hypothetical protein
VIVSVVGTQDPEDGLIDVVVAAGLEYVAWRYPSPGDELIEEGLWGPFRAVLLPVDYFALQLSIVHFILAMPHR